MARTIKLFEKPIKPLRISKSAGLAIGAGVLGILLAGAGAGGGTPTPPGPWTPKWAVGDVLKSHTLDATWRVLQINYVNKQYYCEFTFAGATQQIWVDAAALEDPNIYKV